MHTIVLFENMYFYCMYLTIMKIFSMLGTGYFLKIAKINSQQEKPICFYRKNQFPQNTKNYQSAKVNSHKISCHTVTRKLYEPRAVNSWFSLVTYHTIILILCPNKQGWAKCFAGSQVSKAKKPIVHLMKV